MLCKSFLTLLCSLHLSYEALDNHDFFTRLRSLHLSYEALINHEFTPDYISFSSSKSQKDELYDCFWQWLVYIPRFISTFQSLSRAICSETQRGSFLCRTLVIMCKSYFLDLIYCFAFVDHASTFQAIVAHDSILL